MDADLLPDVGDAPADCVDYVADFVAQDELDVLGQGAGTLAASSSPINRPSFILIGPRMYSYYSCEVMWWCCNRTFYIIIISKQNPGNC